MKKNHSHNVTDTFNHTDDHTKFINRRDEDKM